MKIGESDNETTGSKQEVVNQMIKAAYAYFRQMTSSSSATPKQIRHAMQIAAEQIRRVAGVRSCCRTCSSVAPVIWQLEQLLLWKDHVEEDGTVRFQDNSRLVVDLHACKTQVVITVNAPVGFNLSLDFLPCFQQQSGWIAGSCNGLLLCSNGQSYRTQYYVCNPLTKQWVPLPPATTYAKWFHIGFIFEPCSRSCQQTAPCSNCMYKVVRFHYESLCPQLQFQVESFSSDTGRWNISTVSSPEEFQWCLNLGPQSMYSLFHYRCLHWLVEGGRVVVYYPNVNKIHGVISGPAQSETCLRESVSGSLGLSRGSFWLSQTSSSSSEYLRLWELKGYDHTITSFEQLSKCYWSLRHLINFRQMVDGPDWASAPTSKCSGMLAIHPHDPDTVYLQVTDIDGDQFVISCNLRIKSLGQARFRINYNHQRYWGDVFTLVLPDSRRSN